MIASGTAKETSFWSSEKGEEIGDSYLVIGEDMNMTTLYLLRVEWLIEIAQNHYELELSRF